MTAMTDSPTQALKHYYRQFRELNGDPLGRTALDAWNSARRQVFFRQRLAEDVKRDKARSKAAKKGWKTRRAQGVS